MYIGSHVSIRGGYWNAAKSAAAIGARSFQYFPKNPRSLQPKPVDYADAGRCAEWCRAQGMLSIAHSPYPTNLAAVDAVQRVKTAASLLNDLEIAEACGSVGVVVHFGIYKGPDILEGYRLIIEMLNTILAQWDGKAKLLIENQAGDHANMGIAFEELAQIRRLCHYPDKIMFCLDTCHLFASGQWSAPEDWSWLERASRTGCLEQLGAIHLNDSAYSSGLRRDRHAIIGAGKIGLEALVQLVQLPELAHIPIVLETPTAEGMAHDDQISLLRSRLAGEERQIRED